MTESPEPYNLGRITEPHKWHLFPAYTGAEFGQALLSLMRMPEGEVVVGHLIVTYLLAHPENDRDVGKQDLIRELLDAIQQALMVRRTQT